jgi:hypothetical protein
MKTTVANADRSTTVDLSFQEIDATLIQPTARTYGKKDTKTPTRVEGNRRDGALSEQRPRTDHTPLA